MQLYGYSDRGSQGLHLSRHLWGTTVIAPGDGETQPLWLVVVITTLVPDACHLLAVRPDGLVELQLETEAGRVLGLGLDGTALLALASDGTRLLCIPPDAIAILAMGACE